MDIGRISVNDDKFSFAVMNTQSDNNMTNCAENEVCADQSKKCSRINFQWLNARTSIF